MGVRFDADGESYTRSTGLTSVTVFSFAGWFKLAADRAATTVLLQIDDGTGANYLRINAWNGTALTYQTSGGWFGLIGHTLALNTWTFVALSATANPGQVRSVARAADSATWAGGQTGQSNVTINANTLRVGDGQAASEWFNGSVADVKVWDQALTLDELQQESFTYMPQRTQGLRGWYPFVRLEGIDLSGLSQTLAGGTNAALDDGPPIPWQTGRHRAAIRTLNGSGAVTSGLPALGGSASGLVQVSGSAAAALPGLATSSSGQARVDATAAGALPFLSAAAAGTVDSPGDLAATLPPLGAAAEGATDLPGELTADLPPLGAAVEGAVLFGAVAATLPALDTDLSVAATVAGDTSAALPGFSSELAADVIYDITVTTPGPEQSWSSSPPVRPVNVDGVARGWAAGRPTS
ncbi:LamG-like jellyroll fold domain-containing protein [Nonomuraea angiospora]|uniref:LamG-like jellyroll fold domain-containing protein n=1 Tax=Nonomuraea angiospora TaxID=46172 RepID=UPI0029B55DE8|nr:LamG-like jellyroll fold domain-containing protein [Nonomuraea angiospora]MDX3100458.1 hypothetical protein [Nonomuraea angiospora]